MERLPCINVVSRHVWEATKGKHFNETSNPNSCKTDAGSKQPKDDDSSSNK